MFDTHAHLNLSPLLEEAPQVWKRANEQGVAQAILIGVNAVSSQQAVSLVTTLPGTFAAIGLHPDEVNAISEDDKEELIILSHNPAVVAIGECGLDYVTLQEYEITQAQQERTKQRQLLGWHIQLAKQVDKPLILHCRNTRNARHPAKQTFSAYSDLLDTINHFSKSDGELPRFILHCVSGPIEYVEAAIRLGAYVSFAGNVTYTNAPEILDLLSLVPIDHLLVETDCPYLAPQSKRGQTNEPAFVMETADFLARKLQMTPSEFDIQTTRNAQICFRLP